MISSCKSSALLLELFSPTYVMSYSNLPYCTQLLNYKEELETVRERESQPVCDLLLLMPSQCIQGLFALPQAPDNLMDLEHCRQSGVTAIDAKHC